MRKHIPGFMAGVCVSAAVAWFAWPSDLEPSMSAGTAISRSSGVAPGGIAAGSKAADDTNNSRTPASARDAVAPAQAAAASVPASGARPRESLEVPGGRLDTQRSGEQAPLDKLLSSMSVRCEFDRGAGGYWPEGKVFPHTAAWQGGPLEFESIDIVAAKAQMTGSVGATGTVEGVTEIRVTATNSGLHFSGFKPDGELIVVTVFGALDSQGAYLAAMSTHGTGFEHESAQFYGACKL